ncbi:pilus assembly protein TadG-related protein [Aurantimicrobium minutum]|uniref:pilus assembly protein TadG-related protein n=1 Tax=Aurantimicrobium minutum TaxID=708131 RepID=UPI00248EA9B8|nr:pilus assembly protein TadG-related protein [Aurantimicrobium minutum]
MMRQIENRKLSSDEGSSLILIIFAGLIGLAVIVATMAATSLYIERKRLFTVADSAALISAEAFNLDDVQMVDGVARISLTDTAVKAQAQNYLTIIPAADSAGVQLVSARTPDGVSSEVTLRKTWHPPVVSVFMPDGIDISVTATARTVLG